MTRKKIGKQSPGTAKQIRDKGKRIVPKAARKTKDNQPPKK